MKKYLVVFLFILTLCLGKGYAQNIQLHYQFGRNIVSEFKNDPALITTLEFFKADKYGQTFMFVDLSHTGDGISNAYTEISRELKFWKAPIAIHTEYNGGLNKNFPINNVYLLGVSYLWTSKDFSQSLQVSTSYRHDECIKHISDGHHGMQLTTVWMYNTWNRVFTFSGFFDIWTKKSTDDSNGIVLYSEPQAWINLNQLQGISDHFNLSIGTEIKVSYNFLNKNKLYALPTFGLKWSF